MNAANFFFKYKKIFLAVAFLLAVIGIAYLIYFVFFMEPEPRVERPDEKSTTTGEFGGLPDAEEGGGDTTTTTEEGGIPGREGKEDEKGDDVAQGGETVTEKLNDKPSLSPTLTDDGKGVQYYNEEDGKFYKIDKNGNVIALSDKVFHNVDKVNWSPTKDKAILEYPDGSNIIYNFDKEEQTTLPKHWQDFDFSPTGDEIVMESIGKDPDNRWLAISNDRGGNVRPIEKIGEYDDTVYPEWSPNHQIVGMYTKGKDFNRQEVYFLGKNEENFKSTTIEGRDFRPKWSKEGDKLLYSVYSSNNEMKPKLWSVNASGDKIGTDRTSLDVNTWSDKCTFSSNNEVYCGVPRNLEEGAGLFSEMAEQSVDDLYKIDIETGQKEMVAIPDEDYNISNINVSEDGETLYFTDSESKNIHKINLK